MPWSTFEHTADIGLEATGHDMDTLLRDAANGFFAIVRGEVAVGAKVSRPVAVEAKDLRHLAVEWIDELIFLIDAEGLIFREARDVNVDRTDHGYRLEGVVVGERFDRARHGGAMHVKAVTRHEMVAEEPSGGRMGRVRLILDI